MPAESLQGELCSRTRRGTCTPSPCVCINNRSLLKTLHGWLWLLLKLRAEILAGGGWVQLCSFLAFLLLLPFMSNKL